MNTGCAVRINDNKWLQRLQSVLPHCSGPAHVFGLTQGQHVTMVKRLRFPNQMKGNPCRKNHPKPPQELSAARIFLFPWYLVSSWLKALWIKWKNQCFWCDLPLFLGQISSPLILIHETKRDLPCSKLTGTTAWQNERNANTFLILSVSISKMKRLKRRTTHWPPSEFPRDWPIYS